MKVPISTSAPVGARTTTAGNSGRLALCGNATLLVTALILLFQLRLIVVRAYTADDAMHATVSTMGDDYEYQQLAVNMLRGRGFTNSLAAPIEMYHLDLTSGYGKILLAQYAQSHFVPAGFEFYRTPGLPFLLTAAYALFGVKTIVARLLLAVLAWLTSVCLLLIGRLSGGPLHWLAGGVVAIGFQFSPMIDLTSILTEVPTAFWLVLFVLFYVAYLRRPQSWLLIAASAMFAATVMTRSAFVAALPVLLAVEFMRSRQVRLVVMMAAIVALPVAVWSAYATTTSGRFVGLSTESEINFPEFNNLDVLNGVGPDHLFQGGWNPGRVQDSNGDWYSDYHNAAQPGQSGWAKGLAFWKDNYRDLPMLFLLKLRAGLWYDAGSDSWANEFLAGIGALLLALGFRTRPRVKLNLVFPARYAILVQLGLTFLLLSGVFPFYATLLLVWPLMLLISLLWPYGNIVELDGPNPAWFLSLVAGYALVTAVFGGGTRYHQPLDATLLLFGLMTAIPGTRYLLTRLRLGQSLVSKSA